MAYTLLFVKEFEKDFYKRVSQAKKRIYIQFMTFEGDKAGMHFSQSLIAAKKNTPSLEIKVLIDRYTDRYISQTYYRNPKVREEVLQTKKMIADMESAGIEINRTRPYGFLRLLFMIRNHKKIIVIDDACYLGGINVSEHNYQWHDFMVRCSQKQDVEAVVGDFTHSWHGVDTSYHKDNIFTNKFLEWKYRDMIANAKKEIIISSPFVLDRDLILRFRHRPVRRIVITSKEGNMGSLNYLAKYITDKLASLGVEIYHYKRFSHAKFLLIDRKQVLIGSSNFGQESFSALDEIGIVIDDKQFIKKFLDMMLPNKDVHTKFERTKGHYPLSYVATLAAHYVMKIYVKFFKKWSRLLG